MSRKPVGHNKQLSMSAFLGIDRSSQSQSKQIKKSNAFKSNSYNLLN